MHRKLEYARSDQPDRIIYVIISTTSIQFVPSGVHSHASLPYFFRQLGLLDHPDKQRKLHNQPLPRVGGVPILMAYVGAFGVVMMSPWAATGMAKAALPLALKVLPAATLICAAGLLDDL